LRSVTGEACAPTVPRAAGDSKVARGASRRQRQARLTSPLTPPGGAPAVPDVEVVERIAGSPGGPPAAADGGTSDEALMLAYAAGDVGAFDALYARHKGPLYRYFSRQLAPEHAHDCFQTLWMKVIDARAEYRPDAPLSSYLFTVARNVLMDHYRRHRRHPLESSEDPDTLTTEDAGDPTLSAFERARLKERLLDLVRELPFAQREAWLLQQESGLSQQEICRLTGTTEEGLKSRLRYARQKLKTGLNAYVRQN